MRELTAQAHNTNLDLGAIQNLAVVDPENVDVARFFAYGVLSPASLGHRLHTPKEVRHTWEDAHEEFDGPQKRAA